MRDFSNNDQDLHSGRFYLSRRRLILVSYVISYGKSVSNHSVFCFRFPLFFVSNKKPTRKNKLCLFYLILVHFLDILPR